MAECRLLYRFDGAKHPAVVAIVANTKVCWSRGYRDVVRVASAAAGTRSMFL